MVITGSSFEGNVALGGRGNNIDFNDSNGGSVTCDDGTNTFNNPAGNFPAGLCE